MKFITTLIHALLFYFGVLFTKFKDAWKPKIKQQHKVKSTKIAYKQGESYRLGQCVVTLAKFGIEGKEEVAAKIAAIDKIREEKHKKYTDKAESIMLMTPEELKQFQVEEWIANRKRFNEKKMYENLSEDY